MESKTKFLVTHNVVQTVPCYYEFSEDKLGIYDTLEEAQEGVRKEFEFQVEHSKEEWELSGTEYDCKNFSFDVSPEELESRDTECWDLLKSIRERQVSVSFASNKGEWMWIYNIYEVQYKPKYD